MIRKDPCSVQRFLKATIEGWKSALSAPDDAVSATMKQKLALNEPRLNAHEEREKMNIILKLMKPTYVGDMNYDAWWKLQKLLVEEKLNKANVDLTKAQTKEFLPYYSDRNPVLKGCGEEPNSHEFSLSETFERAVGALERFLGAQK